MRSGQRRNLRRVSVWPGKPHGDGGPDSPAHLAGSGPNLYRLHMNDLDGSFRRFLEDLRSGTERRAWDDRRSDERRGMPTPVEHDRRTPDDRRGEDRRGNDDRRSGEYYAFTERERLEVEAMFGDPEALVACPRCGGQLLLSVPDIGAGTDVTCLGCRGRMHWVTSGGSGEQGAGGGEQPSGSTR